jgi:hypothetical protein
MLGENLYTARLVSWPDNDSYVFVVPAGTRELLWRTGICRAKTRPNSYPSTAQIKIGLFDMFEWRDGKVQGVRFIDYYITEGISPQKNP